MISTGIESNNIATTPQTPQNMQPPKVKPVFKSDGHKSNL